MNKNSIIYILLAAILAVFMLVIEMNSPSKYTKDEYKFIAKKDSISGVVDKAEHSQGYTIIHLKGVEEKILFTAVENTVYSSNYSKLLLGRFLKKEDFISKRVYSDTINVFRGNKHYNFLIKEYNDPKLIK